MLDSQIHPKIIIMRNILIVAFASILLSSCGGENKETPKPAAETPVVSEPGVAGEASFTINVTGNSMADMAYDPTSMTVKSGDKVKIKLVNKNTAEGMLHNWVLIRLGTGAEIASAAIKAGADKIYVPESPDVFAASPLAGPAETVEFEFTAPAKGSYNYICTYPGHFPKMLGKMIVE